MSFSRLRTPGDVAAEAIMHRTASRSTLLIVEGDDDSRFFRGRIDQGACDLIIAGGKLAVVGGIQRLDAHHFRGGLGICDDDCASLEGSQFTSPNLIIAECRDLDTFLVQSPALERLLAEYGDKGAIQKLESSHESVRDNLTRLALPFGRLRWLSARDGLGINFEKLTPFRFLNPDWSSKDDLMVAAAAQVSVDPQALKSRVDALPAANPWLVCQGHDVIALLAIGLDKGGALGSRAPGSKVIASTLRASLDSAPWLTSGLVAEIRRWEAANPPFKVLLNS